MAMDQTGGMMGMGGEMPGESTGEVEQAEPTNTYKIVDNGDGTFDVSCETEGAEAEEGMPEGQEAPESGAPQTAQSFGEALKILLKLYKEKSAGKEDQYMSGFNGPADSTMKPGMR